MSNLYKQWFVHNEEDNTRVINSNAVIGNYIEKNVTRTPGEPDADGFAQGLAMTEVTPVIHEEEPEQAIEDAKAEAENIIEQARMEAEQMVNQAKAEAGQVRESAKKQGMTDGQVWMEQEIAKRKEELEADYQSDRNALETEYVEKRKTMETELVDVILEVFNKVFRIQFDNKKQILMHLIDDAIMNIEGEKNFRIRVAESSVSFLENNKEDILDRVGHDMELEIIADPTLEGNDCIIETDSGVFDCSLGAQLENLIKDIRSLCS